LTARRGELSIGKEIATRKDFIRLSYQEEPTRESSESKEEKNFGIFQKKGPTRQGREKTFRAKKCGTVNRT